MKVSDASGPYGGNTIGVWIMVFSTTWEGQRVNSMKSIRDRARQKFPSVLLTLLSIVQAVALEKLWEQSRLRPDLFDATWMTLLSWLQLTATLLAIIFIWLLYVGLVMRFRFTPVLSDLILPFFVGLF